MKFTKILAGILGLMMFASCGPKELPVALQLYTVRDDMAADFEGTLKKVKEMGYDGVEFAGLFGNEPAKVKEMCKTIGLVPLSAHVPFDEMVADIDKVIADYKAVGCDYIVVPYVSSECHPDGANFLQMVQDIRKWGKKAHEAGLTLLYHNHDFEFKKLPSGQCGLDYLYENVEPDYLQTELDQCWVKYAGYEPVEYLQKYSGRSPVVHLKDFHKSGEQEGDPYALIGLNEDEKKENTAFEFRPLGQGIQDIPSIIEAAKAADSKWLVVEQDQPSMGLAPIECAKASIDYLKSL